MSRLKLINGKGNNTQPPKKESYILNYSLNPLALSGINFIRKYQGNYQEKLTDRLVVTLKEALELSHKLVEEKRFTTNNLFSFYLNQEISEVHIKDVRIPIFSLKNLNHIRNALGRVNPDVSYMTDLLIYNYFDEFLDHFNEKHTSYHFLSKREVFKRSMKENNKILMEILNETNREIKNKKKVTFIQTYDKDSGTIAYI